MEYINSHWGESLLTGCHVLSRLQRWTDWGQRGTEEIVDNLTLGHTEMLAWGGEGTRISDGQTSAPQNLSVYYLSFNREAGYCIQLSRH